MRPLLAQSGYGPFPGVSFNCAFSRYSRSARRPAAPAPPRRLPRGPSKGAVALENPVDTEVLSVARVLRRLRVIGGIGVVLRESCDQPTADEWLQVCCQRVSNFLGIDLAAVDIERERFQIFLLLRWIFDRCLRPLIKRIIFHTVLFGCGDILREGVKLAFERSKMVGKNVGQRRQQRMA